MEDKVFTKMQRKFSRKMIEFSTNSYRTFGYKYTKNK